MNDIKIKKRVAKTFYEKRDIPQPRQEYWPSTAGEVHELMRSEHDVPLVMLGDGQHLRTSVLGERSFDVVRTESCRRVISVDRESKLARVECGIRWGELQQELAERGLSLERYRLYPLTSTVGGLLSRRHPVHREMWDGDIRTFCVALSGSTPKTGDYDYMAAPRKASGPDLRYLFVGAEGLMGAVLDATLVAWAPSDARLYRFEITDTITALRTYKVLHDLGVRISWAHYAPGTLTVAVHAHHRVLKGIAREIAEHIAVPHTTGGADEVTSERHRLESTHPERRALATARRTLTVNLGLNDLAHGLSHLEENAELIEIWDWTRHQARAFVRFPKNNVPSELPTATTAVALAWQPLMDDEAVHWPHWVQTLKGELDPARVLAAGP